MAELTTIARPYAEAAFRLAHEGNALPVWSEMLRLVSAVVAEPKVATALDSPNLAAGDKESLLLSLCDNRLNAEGRNFVRILVEADRVALMPQILEMFGTLKDEADGVARARIESAFALSDAQLAALTAALAKRFGKRIEATVAVDPALIGGARITIGDTVIDGTVQAKLATMAQQLRT
jgi:F-type H+-transporting ATPase subunit delta